jgi:hypothetical protein
MRSLVWERSAEWGPDDDVYVGCSGNMTLERVLADRGCRLHSNDVTGYSCALGWYLTGAELPFTLKPEHAERLDWLAPYLDGRAGTMATLMLGTRFLGLIGKTGRYYERMLAATREQWPTMHGKTRAKLEGLTLQLASFSPMDVREFVADVAPPAAPVVMFPPFYGGERTSDGKARGDYEQQFAGIDTFFDWPAPTYPPLDEHGKDELVRLVVERPAWILGLHVERPELREHLRGVVQTTNRGVSIYVYSAGMTTRIVQPRQQTAPVLMPKLGPWEDLEGPLRLHVLTGPEFSALRSQFMNKSILPGSPLLAVGVSAGGKLIGAFAYSGPKYEPSQAYLLSDFPVAWTQYRRLSKLIVMAAMSDEARHLLQRPLSRRLRTVLTTAFSDNPQSAKYGRGIPGMKLAKREDGGEGGTAKDGVHRYMLNYEGPLGAWDLAGALATWMDKHSSDQRWPA